MLIAVRMAYCKKACAGERKGGAGVFVLKWYLYLRKTAC